MNIGGTSITSEQLSNLMVLLNKNTAAATEHKYSNKEDDSNIISFGNLAGTLFVVSKAISNT